MKILIADDHALFRDGLSLQLEKMSPQAVINQAANFSQALKQLESSADVDLIVIDLDMPDMRWEEGLKENSTIPRFHLSYQYQINRFNYT